MEEAAAAELPPQATPPKTPDPAVGEADADEPVEFTEESLRRSIAELEARREDRRAGRWRMQLGVVPPPGTRVSVRYQLLGDRVVRRVVEEDGEQVQHHEGTVGERLPNPLLEDFQPRLGDALAMVKFDDGSERAINFAVPGISITHEASQSGGAKQADFLINLHKLLTNQEYSNIISYTFDNDGNVLILLKDKLLVANEICPRSANIDFHSCARQFCNYGFKTETRLSIEGIDKKNGLIFSNPKVKSIDDILTLERKISTKCRKSPTIDDGDREANVLAQLNNPSPQSTDMDNNEAANVLASIANISDENTEDLDRRTSYLQNLNTNNEHSLKIALLIEALKNHVIDENQTNQIKQKQNELWQSLKEIELDNTKRKDILYKYMFEF